MSSANSQQANPTTVPSQSLKSTNQLKTELLNFYLAELAKQYKAHVRTKTDHEAETDKVEQIQEFLQPSIMSQIRNGLKGNTLPGTRNDEVGEHEDDAEDGEEDRPEDDDHQDDPSHNECFRRVASLISGSTVMTILAAEYNIPGQPDQMSKITFRSAPRVNAPHEVRSSPSANWAIKKDNEEPENPDDDDGDYRLL